MQDSQAIRQRLRREALERRDEIPANLRVAFSHMIKRSAMDVLEELHVRTVHCYLSFRSEVDTAELVHALQADGVVVATPVTVDGVLEHYEVTEHLTIGEFGVPEPERTRKVNEDQIDAVIVPIVSYDGTGTRLGYGKGYYDRFLDGLDENVPRIGLAFSAQESDAIPRLPHDVQMTMIVTEQGIVRPGR